MLLRTPPPRQRPPAQPGSESPEERGPFSLHRRLWEQTSMSTPYHHTINVPSPPKRPRFVSGEDEPGTPSFRTPIGAGQQLVPYGQSFRVQDSLVRAEQGEHLEEDEEPLPLDWDSMRCSYKCTNMVKAELLATLESSSKQVVELESSSKSLRARLDAAEVENKVSQKRISSLEQTIQVVNAREKSLQSQRMSEVEKAEELLRQQLKRCNELQARLQQEMKLKAEAEASASVAIARAVDAEAAKDKLAESAAWEAKQLKEQLERLKKDNESVVSRLQTENMLERGHVQSTAAEGETLKVLVEDLHKRLAESNEEKRELEHKLCSAVAQAATRITSPSEADSVIKHLREELTQNSADVLEARKLKKVHTNAELLKEKLESERERADRAEAALSNLVDMELRICELEGELQAWKDTVNQLPGVSRREDVLPKFEQLQKEVLAESAKTGQVSTQVAELRKGLEIEEAAKLEACSRAESALGQVAEVNVNLKRMERKMALLTRERDGLKAILASYDEEEAVILSHQKSGSIVDLATPEKVKQKRVQELESALEDARRHSESLEESLDATSAELKAALARVGQLTNQLKEAEGRITALEGAESALREFKIGRGDFNPATTKVLRMLNSLEIGADERHVQLQAEVDSLRHKLQLIQQGSAGLECDKGGHNRDNEVLRLTQRVTSLEKREARYRQVFADKIAAFREACYLLFGYTVKMTEQPDSSGLPLTLLTLRSKYAQSDDEQLEFQYTSGCVNMIENSYTSSPDLAPQVNTFLRKWNCIPAFIANLTIESFNKVTMG